MTSTSLKLPKRGREDILSVRRGKKKEYRELADSVCLAGPHNHSKKGGKEGKHKTWEEKQEKEKEREKKGSRFSKLRFSFHNSKAGPPTESKGALARKVVGTEPLSNKSSVLLGGSSGSLLSDEGRIENKEMTSALFICDKKQKSKRVVFYKTA